MPGFGSVGVWEVILILAILLLVFGARRLPEIGSALGKGIREFKSSVKDIEGEIHRGASGSDRPRNDLPRSETRNEPTARSETRNEPTARPTPDEGERAETSTRPLETEKRSAE